VPVDLPARWVPGDAARRGHDRPAVRGGGHRPVPVVERGDLSRMLVLPGTFRFEHDGPADKSNGELFPTAIFLMDG